MNEQKIFLIGFMGSGKTAYGKPLAELLNVDFFDLDSYIEKIHNRSIAKIFAEDGEEKFREYERNALREITFSNNRFVLATGGGTPCFSNNIEFINANGTSIYLQCAVEELCENILLSNPARPLLQNKCGNELYEHVKQLLSIRKPIYEQAKIILTGKNHNPQTIFEIYKSQVELTRH
ncbi:MAG: shikimate kinase [Prevotellaceae bacterium]|jgi:shikimate kinase|nr:shikimate kinase [Prevotellaceae bacterium]